VIANPASCIKFSERNYLYSIVKSCFADNDKLDPVAQSTQSKKSSNRAVAKEIILLTYCFVGLMGSYLTWGVLQEKIMTREYDSLDGKRKSFFKDSQFLVFANRFLALIIATIYLLVRQQNRHRAPLFKYSYASFSNIMSAWLQYEALKFISFPTQVLAKSCKIIPVMIMGRIISRNKYEFYEYVVAVAISVGMVFFLSGSYDQSKHTAITTITGMFLLCMYMIFDSFTSNWQSDLFKSYGITSLQMMWGVNLFSSLFTGSSLLVQGGFAEGIQFSSEHPKFLFDCIVLSVSSAVGQLFIFFTIAKFGAVVFTIIMTLRQAVAILLSCLIYNHNISPLGVFGIVIVFLAIFVRVYSSHRIKILRRKHELLKQRLNV
jgi:solute carrier family 35 (adenosine 3'-phospho 5'-phosphosulfate transporter), member B2